jgi:predicted amidohydrolase YtcJ
VIIKGAEVPFPASSASQTRASPVEGDSVPPATVDVRIGGGVICSVEDGIRPRPGERVIEAGGGAVLPGLHDHHLHLFSMAAALRSVPCGPRDVRGWSGLASSLAQAADRAPAGEWVRGVGYHESVAGELDRLALDAMVPDRPVRVQHRSGQLWMLNSAGLRALGVEVARHRGDGRLYRGDEWLRTRRPEAEPSEQDLTAVSRALAAAGVTGVTDATVSNGLSEASSVRDALSLRRLVQHVHLMGRDDRVAETEAAEGEGDRSEGDPTPELVPAQLKVVLHDDDLRGPDDLAACFAKAHQMDRGVAVHCVTRAELVVALEAFRLAGVDRRDRIEHAGVVPDELVMTMAALRLTVVTQPNFVAERGDTYERELDTDEVDLLYRLASLDRAGVPVGAGTDAPFGRPDPWAAMAAAVSRQTVEGEVLGPAERVSPERALALFTSPPGSPGGRPRRVAAGSPADLVLLGLPWRAARRELTKDLVRATVVRGELVHLVA